MNRVSARMPLSGDRGGTLIEVTLACLILAIVALGGGAFLWQSRSCVVTQGNKRVAVEVASARIEAVRAAGFQAVKPASADYEVRYLRCTTGVWSSATAECAETVLINNLVCPIATTIQYADADGGTPSYDGLRIRVALRYAGSAGDTLVLETLLAP